MTAALAPAPSTPRTADDGSVRFLAAITGVPDQVGDVLVPGCFQRTLARIRPKIVDGHDWKRLVGRVTEAIELLPGDKRLPARTPDGEPWPRDAGALLVHGQFNLATEAGRNACENSRFFGADASYSIGYKVRPGGARHRGGQRHITDCDLFEVSPVLFGAHGWARQLPAEVKSRPPAGLEVKTMPTRRRDAVITRAERERARWSKLRAIRADVEAKSGTVPLGELDQLRHERIGRAVGRWDRENGDDDREPFAQLAARGHRYEMTSDGTLLRVLPCASCASSVRFPARAPVRPGVAVRCPGCRGAA